MIHLFCVKDLKAGLYEKPFTGRSIPEAIRNIGQVAADKKSMLNAYPKDFALYQLGSVDQETGRVSVPEEPVFITTVFEVMPDLEKENEGR